MFYDKDDNPINNFSFSVNSADEQIMTLQIDCASGKSLRSQTVSDLAVSARHGTSGSWTDLETTGLDLGAWNGSRETFQIRFVAAPVSSVNTKNFSLYVS